jgi:hypothetical protein
MPELSSLYYVINSAFFDYNSSKKGVGDDFNIFGLLSSRATNPQKISFLGGPAHFVKYGGGDGLVDNNNALATIARALNTNTAMQNAFFLDMGVLLR